METVLVKKSSNGEDLELVDSECFYLENQSGECTAPPSYRCPYRRFKMMTAAPHGGQTPARSRVFSKTRPVRLIAPRK